MAIQLQQTDTAATEGSIQACGRAVGAGAQRNSQATKGGTAGSATTPAITVNASVSDKGYIFFETNPGELDAYQVLAGIWVVRVNVTTGAASGGTVTFTSVFICRLNAAGVSQATIGSLTGQTASVDNTGVASFTVTGVAQTPNGGDKIYIEVNCGNSDISNHSFNIKFDQLIDTPMISAPDQRLWGQSNDLRFLSQGGQLLVP